MALSNRLRHALSLLAVTSLVLGIAEASIVRRVEDLRQIDVSGLTHVTLAGAVDNGHKEVEAWVETIAPGCHTPIHRHDIEEIFIIVKGRGTVYIAPGPGQSENKFPGEPVATPFSANSTFSIPVNSVHQVFNTNDEDLSLYVAISKPPAKPYMYETWNTPHDEAFYVQLPWDKPDGPLYVQSPWDKPEEATSTKDEL